MFPLLSENQLTQEVVTMVSNTTFHIFWQSGASVFGFLLLIILLA